MNILIVTATEKELCLIKTRIESFKSANLLHQYSFLITGIGIARSTFSIAQALLTHHYDFVIQLGVAGSYSSEINVGEVLWITRDTFSDLGADTKNGFLSLQELNLAAENFEVSFNAHLLKNIPQPNNLIKATAITSDTIHNNPNRITEIYNTLHPDVESMEGAAIMYVCNQLKVPNIQVRAISNRVVPREANEWNINIALEALDQWFIKYLENLETSAL